MKTIILTILLASSWVGAEAQIIDFGFGSPYVERRQQPQQQVIKPKYKNGAAGVNEFIKKHFRYLPAKASVSGRITVACLINEKGKVAETEMLQGLDRDLNQEAVRVCRLLKFKPAKRGKQKVKSRYDVTFPIRHGKVSFITAPTVDL